MAERSIKVFYRNNIVRIQQTGRSGPAGPTGISTFVRVHHQSNPNTARPNALYVEWVGSVVPINGTTEDTWVDTS